MNAKQRLLESYEAAAGAKAPSWLFVAWIEFKTPEEYAEFFEKIPAERANAKEQE